MPGTRAMEPNTAFDQASPADGQQPAAETAVEPDAEDAVQQGGATRIPQPRFSPALAAANSSPLRFPGEDGGRSLSDMAQRDLDAALQLLADRAQYITGAAGAAIALRRSGKSDMLCRASTGENAPELGALLSTEFGLSGECVRTRQALRCDDTERDARVNREVCRQMGIASVAVMPVLQENDVLGVFELFSGNANAFGERDFSALERLSQMVETAVRLAHAAELPELLAAESADEVGVPETEPADEPVLEVGTEAVATEAAIQLPEAIVVPVPAAPQETLPQTGSPEPQKPAAPQPPLFWSAPPHSMSAEAQQPEPPDQSHVPPMLRNLRQCQACGFPVSAGRSLCVECEEKRWRGQLKVSALAKPRQVSAPPPLSVPGPRAFAAAAQSAGPPIQAAQRPITARAVAAGPLAASPAPENVAASAARPALSPEDISKASTPPAPASASELILSAGLQPAQSWFAANKYVLGALLVVAAIVATILVLR